jgi:predicted RNA-binding protein
MQAPDRRKDVVPGTINDLSSPHVNIDDSLQAFRANPQSIYSVRISTSCVAGPMVEYWITPTNAEAWELVKRDAVYAFEHHSQRSKINVGDRLVFYLIRSKPPVFVGICEVIGHLEEAREPFWPDEKASGRVIYRWRYKLKLLICGAVNARSLSQRLSYVVNKENWQRYLMGSIANLRKSIPKNDYELIEKELAGPAVPYEIKENV